MAVPNTFATATSAIPLANLDANFAYYDGAFSISGAATTFSGAVTLTSNLTFTGTGNRITGDFSNATIASRAIFQTSTVNGLTTVSAIPNGTSPIAGFSALSASDPTNSSTLSMLLRGDTGDARFTSGITGTGTYLPMTFYTGNSERMRLDTSGNVVIGNSVDNNTRVLNFNSVSGGSSSIQSITVGATNQALTFSTTFATLGERMRITGDGNLGIGTTSPAGKLEVSGGRSWFTANSELYSIAFRYSSSAGVMYMGATNSVSTPSIQFSNSGGTALATIDYSGNVGIGTSSPGAKLDVQVSSNEVLKLTATTGTNSIYQTINNTGGSFTIGRENSAGTAFGVSAYASVLFSAGAYPMVFATQNIERMRINSSGQVGIGTSAPTGQLDVRSAAGVVAQSNLYTGSNAAVVKFNIGQVGAIDWDIGLNATAGNFYIGGLGGSMAEAYKIVRSGLSIDYQTWNTGGAERMRIDSSGNVNIGSAATTAAAGGRVFDIYNLENTNSSSYALTRLITYNVAGTTTVSADIFKNKAGSFVFNNNETNAAANTSFGIGGTERMRIDSSGNVGIGTSSPVGKLDVSSSGQNIVVSRSTGSYAAFQRLAPTGQQTYDFYTINGVEVARITGDPSYLAFSTGSSATERARIDSSGNVLVTNPAGLGYGTGSGGTVTQATSRTTAVTINKPTGAITLVSAAGSPAWQEFTVNNSIVTANDTCVLNQRAGTDRYVLQVRSISAGAFVIAFQTTSGTTTEQPIFNFAIIKGAVA
jgi:hypothetical protein